MQSLESIDHRLLAILLCEKAYGSLKASLAAKGLTIYAAVVALHMRTRRKGVVKCVLDCMTEAERFLG